MAKILVALIITAALVACLFACAPQEKTNNSACIAEVKDDTCVTVTFSADNNSDVSVSDAAAVAGCVPVPVKDSSAHTRERDILLPGVRDFKNVIKQ